jgi:regulatory associated protein of mTOR
VLECWLDPNKLTGPQDIISAVHAQFLRLMPRAKFKLICDPTTDEMHSMAALRRSVDTDRIVFHYNGHGVPKPTAAGEVFSPVTLTPCCIRGRYCELWLH